MLNRERRHAQNGVATNRTVDPVMHKNCACQKRYASNWLMLCHHHRHDRHKSKHIKNAAMLLPAADASTVHTEVGCSAKLIASRSTFPPPRSVRSISLCPDRPSSERRRQERIESVLSICRRAWLQQICTRLSTQQPSYTPAQTRPIATGIFAWGLKHSHDCVF